MLKYILLTALAVTSITAYPGGAPDVACDFQIPQHGLDNELKFGNDYPFDLKVNVISNRKVRVELKAQSYQPMYKYWKGLMLTLRNDDTEKNDGELTRFIAADYRVLCDGRNGITHRRNEKKTFAEFEWDNIRTDKLKLFITIVFNKNTTFVAFHDIDMSQIGVQNDKGELINSNNRPENRVQETSRSQPTTRLSTRKPAPTTTKRRPVRRSTTTTRRPTTTTRRPTTTTRRPTTTTRRPTTTTRRPTTRKIRPTVARRLPPIITTTTTRRPQTKNNDSKGWRYYYEIYKNVGQDWWKVFEDQDY